MLQNSGESALGFQPFELPEHSAMFDDDLNATNGPGCERIRPRQMPVSFARGNQFSLALPPASWNVVRLKKAR